MSTIVTYNYSLKDNVVLFYSIFHSITDTLVASIDESAFYKHNRKYIASTSYMQ